MEVRKDFILFQKEQDAFMWEREKTKTCAHARRIIFVSSENDGYMNNAICYIVCNFESESGLFWMSLLNSVIWNKHSIFFKIPIWFWRSWPPKFGPIWL